MQSNAGPTPLPPGYLPTAVALTLAARSPTPAAPLEDTRLATTASSPGSPAGTPDPAGMETASPAPLIGSPTPAVLVLQATPVPATLPPPAATQAAKVPPAAVQIFRPGDLSRVASPFTVIAAMKPGARGDVRAQLFGEDGRVLTETVKTFYSNPGLPVNFWLNVSFKISGVAEAGKLVLSISDDGGRLVALNSVDLILLSIGAEDVSPSIDTLEPIIIQQPAAKTLIQGGTVLVSGLARLAENLPLEVQLVTADGKLVGQGQTTLSRPSGGGYGLFAAEVPYTVSALTPVRLSVLVGGQKASPIAHLSSVEIMLSP
ncbi:MAG TPA: hypothetical protein VF498_18895 [Anaerolineales bacterium]